MMSEVTGSSTNFSIDPTQLQPSMLPPSPNVAQTNALEEKAKKSLQTLGKIIKLKPHVALSIELYKEAEASGRSTWGRFRELPVTFILLKNWDCDLLQVLPDDLAYLAGSMHELAENVEICVTEIFKALINRQWSRQETAILSGMSGTFSAFPESLKTNEVLKEFYVDWAPLKWCELKYGERDPILVNIEMKYALLKRL